MAAPVKRTFCEKYFGCCLPTPIKTVEKKTVIVSRTTFEAAIGNSHRKVASTDILTDHQFIRWLNDEKSYNKYMETRATG